MNLEITPTRFEAYDGTDGVFVVEMFDESAAEVTISTVVNVELWDEIAPKIRECLLYMALEGG